MNINYFYLTNQMTASLSWNSFVTEGNQLVIYYSLVLQTHVYSSNNRRCIPVNLSDPHGRRSPAIQNEKAGD